MSDEPRFARDGRGRLYRVASREYSLAEAQRMLDRLYGRPAARRKPAEAGVCDDCKHEVGVRWRYGKVTVCLPCVLQRMAVAQVRPLDSGEARWGV